jgi:hypothetical protein
MLALATGLLVCGIVASYAASSVVEKPYLTHPLWLGAPLPLVKCVIAAQIVAIACYAIWVLTVTPTAQTHVFNTGFLLSQALWPHVANFALESPRILACVPLWVSAVCVALLARDESLLWPTAFVVVFLDGAMWTLRALTAPLKK